MRVEELTVEVRNESLERVGQILPADLVGFKAVLRFNNVGTWEIELPVGHPVGEMLRLPGYGIVVTGPEGVILSGPTTSAENTKERGNPDGTWLITGSDDSIILAERLAYPTPTTADVTMQSNAYDTVTNTKASTAMYGYVKRNLVGGIAPVERVVPFLSCAADTNFGTNVTKSARFNILGELLSELAIVDGLGFDIKQQDGQLVFNVFQPSDRSKEIRMDIANNTLSKTSYGYALPGVTKAIVAGQGQGEGRTFVEVTTSEATSAQELWGRRIENFIDQRNTSDSEELNRAGLERLAEAGNTITSVDVVPNSDTTMVPFVDWDLGDKVGVVIGGQEVAAIVTQIALSIESDGVRIGATVGEPAGVDYEALIAKRQQDTSRSINALERKEGGGGGASIITSDTAPVGASANTLWLDSTSSNLFANYQDADSTQWVQIAGGGGENLSSRVATVEANANLLDSRLDSLEPRVNNMEPSVDALKAGFYLRQVEVQVDTTGRTFSTSWGLGPTFPTLTYRSNSKIKLMYHIPMRNDASGWGGIYVEPQVQFNGGTWQSLGSTGHEMMHLGNADIATYKNDILIDPGFAFTYTAAFRFYVRAYEGTVGWNNGINHDINVTSGTATIMSGNNGNQHFMHIIIEEIAKA